MSRFAIIDFGSNTIRLCIYEIDDKRRASLTQKDITLLLNYKKMTGIVSYINDGILSDKGIKKAARTINDHAECAAHFKCDQLAVFATAVLRNCTNSVYAKQAIEKATGLPITLLSNEEEAHLGVVGAQLDGSIDDATFVDIGGGSTELTAIDGDIERARTSIPQGSLSSFSTFVKGLLPTKREMRRIAKAFNQLYSVYPRGTFNHDNLVGIGGSIRSAAKVYGDIFDKGKCPRTLYPEHIALILHTYQRDAQAFFHAAIQTIPDRIHTFIPGCILIQEVFAQTGARQLTIAKHGIREGFLVERVLKN